MEDFVFISRNDIADADILNNISDKTTAIMIDNDNCWIEINAEGFFVPDGWSGTQTKNLNEAIEELKKFKRGEGIINSLREEQSQLQHEVIHKAEINIVTCGNCGSVVLHRTSVEEIQCPDCGFKSEPCDFPDLNW